MTASGEQVVLVVEDSEEDREAIQRALSRSHPELVLEFLPDGHRVSDRLRDDTSPHPVLVLLDLNMPGTDGLRVLTELRADADPRLRDVIVVVFTSSTTSADIDRCYEAGADSYVYKPVNFTLFRTVLQGAVEYWHTNGFVRPSAPPEVPVA
ncbi:response regulator [Lentzea sp. NPDC058436]|uniref:response regulator n=1 Tax=Lentzea sp. NPDC058436 TaxID=3346499 RepID=UPI00364EDB8A